MGGWGAGHKAFEANAARLAQLPFYKMGNCIGSHSNDWDKWLWRDPQCKTAHASHACIVSSQAI